MFTFIICFAMLNERAGKKNNKFAVSLIWPRGVGLLIVSTNVIVPNIEDIRRCCTNA